MTDIDVTTAPTTLSPTFAVRGRIAADDAKGTSCDRAEGEGSACSDSDCRVGKVRRSNTRTSSGARWGAHPRATVRLASTFHRETRGEVKET